MLISKQQILQSCDLAHEDVAVPEWGGTVRVRCLTGAEREEYDSFRLRAREKGDWRGVMARLLVLSLVDEQGQRLFAEADVPLLASKSGKVLDRLTDVALRLSGLTDQAVKDLEKNSEAAPNGDSGSG